MSVITPTYNERGSLPLLVSRLAGIGRQLNLELVVVDDASPDGTGALADELAKTAQVPLTVVHRPGKAGLASAVISGAAAARAAPDMFSVLSFPLAGQVAPPALSRGRRMGVRCQGRQLGSYERQ